MAKIKKFDELNEETQAEALKEWLPKDFDFRDYVENNLPGLARKVLVPRDIDHVASLLERLANLYNGKKDNDEFLEYLLSEKYDKALLEADDVNKIAFYVYLIFQINKVPLALRGKNTIQK